MTDLDKAVERVRGFADRWRARIGFGAQTSDLIYAVTVHGFEGDAELRASDLRTVLAALSQAEARVKAAEEVLREALARVAYVPGDHPFVPVKHAAFAEEVRSLLAKLEVRG